MWFMLPVTISDVYVYYVFITLITIPHTLDGICDDQCVTKMIRIQMI